MKLFRKLWNDEAGVLLSAEAAVIGTVAVVGLGTGLHVVAESVNEELKEVGYAIRSLDQSYTIPAQKGCGAWTAGSEFQQQPVEESLEELRKFEKKVERAAKKQAKRLKERVEKQNRKPEPDSGPQKESQPDEA